jgi:hypothetical protein
MFDVMTDTSEGGNAGRSSKCRGREGDVDTSEEALGDEVAAGR